MSYRNSIYTLTNISSSEDEQLHPQYQQSPCTTTQQQPQHEHNESDGDQTTQTETRETMQTRQGEELRRKKKEIIAIA
jgi:hypothetical protein